MQWQVYSFSCQTWERTSRRDPNQHVDYGHHHHRAHSSGIKVTHSSSWAGPYFFWNEMCRNGRIKIKTPKMYVRYTFRFFFADARFEVAQDSPLNSIQFDFSKNIKNWFCGLEKSDSTDSQKAIHCFIISSPNTRKQLLHRTLVDF